ncbi:MAG: Fe-S cluster assembly protein SufB, partial [Candidatus Anstonellales archaeon]
KIPEAERNSLAGVTAQYESNVLYEKINAYLERLGVVFLSMDDALKKYPEIVKRYFATLVPINDNKFAALNTAFWSGGSFVYVPRGVKVDKPLQAYFRIQNQSMGQFERTLIIAEPESEVSYIEGCSAPIYSKDSLHAAVVEVFALENSRVRYTTVQNWSKNVYNLVTKRAIAHENSYVEWLDGNLGSKYTYKYPAIYLKGKGARAKILSIASAGQGQVIDSGGKAIHLAPNTSSTIISKSISMEGGTTKYRGWIKVAKGAVDSKISVSCDALLLDEISRTDTYPYIDIHEKNIHMTHEATVGKIEEEQLFYLMSRGFNEDEAKTMIVLGFIEEFVKEIPLEYAVELNRLIMLEMEGSVG